MFFGLIESWLSWPHECCVGRGWIRGIPRQRRGRCRVLVKPALRSKIAGRRVGRRRAQEIQRLLDRRRRFKHTRAGGFSEPKRVRQADGALARPVVFARERKRDAVPIHALDLLRAYDLPQERLPVLERECESFRAIAIERLNWCQHIELIENLKHTDRKDTHYSVDPLRRCFCSLHKYESAIESTDWVSLIRAFKGAYCEGCPDRQPKSQ